MRQEARSWFVSFYGSGLKIGYRPDPASAPHELALAQSIEFAIIGQEMQERLRAVRGQQTANRLIQKQFAALHWSVRKKRGMKMSVRACSRSEQSDEGRDLGPRFADGDADEESEIAFVRSLGSKRKPVTHAGICQR